MQFRILKQENLNKISMIYILCNNFFFDNKFNNSILLSLTILLLKLLNLIN